MIQQGMRYQKINQARDQLHKLAETELQHLRPSDYERDDCVKILHAYATCRSKHGALKGLISECARDVQLSARDASTTLWASSKLVFMDESKVLLSKTLSNNPSINDLIRTLYVITDLDDATFTTFVPKIVSSLPQRFQSNEREHVSITTLIHLLSKQEMTPQIIDYVSSILFRHLNVSMCDTVGLLNVLSAIARQQDFLKAINVKALVSRIIHQIDQISDPLELKTILRSAAGLRFTDYSFLMTKLSQVVIPRFNFTQLDMDSHAAAYYFAYQILRDSHVLDNCNSTAINKLSRGLNPSTSLLQSQLFYAIAHNAVNRDCRNVLVTMLDDMCVSLRRNCSTSIPLKNIALGMIFAKLETHVEIFELMCMLSQRLLLQFNPRVTCTFLRLLLRQAGQPIARNKWFSDTSHALSMYAGRYIEYYSHNEVKSVAYSLMVLRQSDRLVWDKIIKQSTTAIDPSTLYQVTTSCTALRIVSTELLDAASEEICSRPSTIMSSQVLHRLIRTFGVLSPSGRGSQIKTLRVLCQRVMQLDSGSACIESAITFLKKFALTGIDQQLLRRLKSISGEQEPLRDALKFLEHMDHN